MRPCKKMTRFGQGLTENMGDPAPSLASSLQWVLGEPRCLVFGADMVIICTVIYYFLNTTA